MKTKLLLIACVGFILMAFIQAPFIPSCFLNFKGYKDALIAGEVQKKAIAKPYKIKTGKADHLLSATEANVLIYANAKKTTLIQLRVEQSTEKQYGKDTTAVYNNFKLQMSQGKNFENSKITEQNYNGNMVYGYSHNALEKDSIQSSYAIFPGNNCIIYIDFFRVKPDQRTYQTIGEYRAWRNGFIGNYTAHLRRCLIKE